MYNSQSCVVNIFNYNYLHLFLFSWITENEKHGVILGIRNANAYSHHDKYWISHHNNYYDVNQIHCTQWNPPLPISHYYCLALTGVRTQGYAKLKK